MGNLAGTVDDDDEEGSEGSQSETEAPRGGESNWKEWQLELRTITAREERDRFICEKSTTMGYTRGREEGYKQAGKEAYNRRENERHARLEEQSILHQILTAAIAEADLFAKHLGTEMRRAAQHANVDLIELIHTRTQNNFLNHFPRPTGWSSKEGKAERLKFFAQVHRFKLWDEQRQKEEEDGKDEETGSDSHQNDGETVQAERTGDTAAVETKDCHETSYIKLHNIGTLPC